MNLCGLELPDLQPNEIATEAILLIRTIDPDARAGWALRHTDNVDPVTIIGALQALLHHELAEFEANWQNDE